MATRTAPKVKYDLRLEGKGWNRGLSRDELFSAIHAAFEGLFDDRVDMLFLVEQTAGKASYENYFCTTFAMWECLCETPETMAEYLRLSWEE